MMQKLSGESLRAVRRFRRTLVDLVKSQPFNAAPVAMQINMLNETALTEYEVDDPPELQVSKERFLLEMHWFVISRSDNEFKLLKALIDRHDQIGYGCPARWGVLRLDLADMFHQRGMLDEARKLREAVRDEYHKMQQLIDGLILDRLT